MSEQQTGGNGGQYYAFPIPEKATAAEVQHGMTLRDYFAALAMQAILGKDTEVVTVAGALPGVRIAALAYDIANAMIDERAG